MGYYDDEGHYRTFRYGVERAANRILGENDMPARVLSVRRQRNPYEDIEYGIHPNYLSERVEESRKHPSRSQAQGRMTDSDSSTSVGSRKSTSLAKEQTRLKDNSLSPKHPTLPENNRLPTVTISTEKDNAKVFGLDKLRFTALHPGIPPRWFGTPDFFTNLVSPYRTNPNEDEIPALPFSIGYIRKLWLEELAKRPEDLQKNRNDISNMSVTKDKLEASVQEGKDPEVKGDFDLQEQRGRTEYLEGLKTSVEEIAQISEQDSSDLLQANAKPMDVVDNISVLEGITRDYMLWELRMETEELLKNGTTDREQLLRIRKLYKEYVNIWHLSDFWNILKDQLQDGGLQNDALFQHTSNKTESESDLQTRITREVVDIHPAVPEVFVSEEPQYNSTREARQELRKQNRLRKLNLKYRLIGAAIGSVAFVAPMIIMSISPSVTKSLITSSVFILGFSTLFAVVSSASAETVLLATAAYATVLVVFVGANNS